MTSKGSLGRRLTAGILANGFSQTVTIGVQLVSVPVLLWAWGAELYGIWLLLSAVPAYLALADLGFAQVGASDMTMQVANGDREAAKVSYDTIFAMNCVLAVIAFAGMAAFAFSPLSLGLVGEAHASADIRWALLVLAGYTLLTLVQGILGAGLRSEGHFAVGTALFAGMRILDCGALLGAAMAGGDLLNAALAMVVCRSFATGLLAWRIQRIWPWLRLGFGKAAASRAKEMLGPSLHFSGYTLGNLVSIQGTLIAIGVTLGPSMVAVASTARTLTRVGVAAANMLNTTLQPEYSALFGRAETGQIGRLFRFHLTSILAVALLYVVAMLTLGPLVFDFWTHGKVVLPLALFNLLTLSAAGEMLWIAVQTAAVAFNRITITGVCYLIVSCAALWLLTAWATTFGIVLAGWLALASTLAMLAAASVQHLNISRGLERGSAS